MTSQARAATPPVTGDAAMPIAERRLGRIDPLTILAALIVVALLLRFYKLGVWNFEATEMFTHRDSIVTPRPTNPRPLIYVLNYYVVRPLMTLDEFGLRFLPAVFGVLGIPALYYSARRLAGSTAAMWSALLLTVSALHVFYSQLARYWSAVFLFSAIYPYALYVGIRDRDRRAVAVGLLAGLLAVLAHPVSILLVGGPALLLLSRLRRAHLASLWRQQTVRWVLGILAIVLVAVVVRFVPILQAWITMHDQNPGSGQFLLRAPMAFGLKQVFYVIAYFESLSAPIALAAFAGFFLLWQRDRFLGWFIASVALFPVLFLALISFRTPVSQFYLLATAPAFYLAAGVFVERLFALDWRVRPNWVLPTVVLLGMLATGTPTLVSQYRNGRRFDFRGVAQWLGPRLTPRDVIFSDQPMVLAHYLPGRQVQKLRFDTVPLRDSVAGLPDESSLWVVAPAPAHALRTNLRQGGLAAYLYGSCQMSNTVGKGRVDFRQQYLQVYRCPPRVTDEPDRQPDS
ncbi:MAG TPA: glycosyltransferase family 39 protein [Gemmatimonadales bacterium]|nr:glycosyltransferase family 39 protein [Gemmatimonadales bacterium]